MQRSFTQIWLNSFWIGVACSVLPFISNPCTWKTISLLSRNLYKCKQVTCSVVVACLLDNPHFVVAFLIFYINIVHFFVNHVHKSIIFVFEGFIYNFKNTISIFVTTFSICFVKSVCKEHHLHRVKDGEYFIRKCRITESITVFLSFKENGAVESHRTLVKGYGGDHASLQTTVLTV